MRALAVVSAGMHACMYVYTYIYDVHKYSQNENMYAHTCVYILMYRLTGGSLTSSCIHTHIHTYIHTYIRTYTDLSV
jgi:hypothetical protein